MKTERILAIIALLCYSLKLLHWPATVFLILSLSVLSLIYWPLAFYFFSEKKLANQNLALTIPSGLLFSAITIGVLYRLQFWPGISFMPAGIVGCIIVFYFAFMLSKKASSDELKLYYKRMLRRTVIMFSISVLFTFVTSHDLLLLQYRDATEVAIRDKLYSPSTSDSVRDRLHKELMAYTHHRDSLNSHK